MKKHILTLLAVAVLALSLTACGNNKNANANNDMGNTGSALEDQVPNNDTNLGDGANGAENTAVNKDDCNTIYAKVVSVNGDNLTVEAQDRVLSLTVSSEMLTDWRADDEVVLYYTGEFGEDMTVRYIDKWTENSEVQRPQDQQTNANDENGGSVIG